MLPGLRLLFAAIVLSLSVLIFGLGAAALLRATHQELAHTPARKPLPELVFAQPAEPAPPVLALLRVEPTVVEEVTEEAETTASPPDALPEQAAEPEKPAALQSGDTATADEQKPETTASIAPQTSDPAMEDAPAPPVADSPPSATADNPAVSAAAAEPSTPLASPQTSQSAVRLATLGELNSAVEPHPSAKPASAKSKRKAVRKRAQAHRAKNHAHRAKKKQVRIAQPDPRRAAPVQRQADPFAALTLTRPAR